MNCFKKYDLQAYFDNELNSDLRSEIQFHLKECPVCSEELENIKDGKDLLDTMFSSLDPNEVVIPDFKATSHRPRSRKIILPAVITSAVASISLLIVLFLPEKRDPDQITIELLFQDYLESQDPNQLWHSKTQLYFTENENGELTVISSK
jgi:hypothetical protein